MDKKLISGFKDELTKLSWTPWGKSVSVPNKVVRSIAAGAGIGAAASVIDRGIDAVGGWYDRKKLEEGKKPVFDEMLKQHPELKDYPFDKVLQYFNTLYTFSPNLAKDPLSAGAFIRQAIRMDEFGGPSYETIKTLGDIEKKVQETTSSPDKLRSLGGFPKIDIA